MGLTVCGSARSWSLLLGGFHGRQPLTFGMQTTRMCCFCTGNWGASCDAVVRGLQRARLLHRPAVHATRRRQAGLQGQHLGPLRLIKANTARCSLSAHSGFAPLLLRSAHCGLGAVRHLHPLAALLTVDVAQPLAVVCHGA